jgi:hypothetical protein
MILAVAAEIQSRLGQITPDMRLKIVTVDLGAERG